MEEQSHKDEMRAALRGDFERMRRRQVTESEPAGLSAPPAEVTEAEPQHILADCASGSWLDRLLGRA